jgi:hypothetical protein
VRAAATRRRRFRKRDQIECGADEWHRRKRDAEGDLEGRVCRRSGQDRAGTEQILGERNDLVATRPEILDHDADPRLGSSERMLARPAERRGDFVARRRCERARCVRVEIGQALEPLHIRATGAQRPQQPLLLRCDLEEAGEHGRARVSAEVAAERGQRIRQQRQIAALDRAQSGSIGLRPTREDCGIVGVVRIAAPCPPALTTRAPLVNQRPRLGRQRGCAAGIEQGHALFVGLDQLPPMQRRLRRRQEQCGVGHCTSRHGLGPKRFEPLRIRQD